MPRHQTNGPKDIAQMSIGAKCDKKTGTLEFSIIIGFKFLILFSSLFNTHLSSLLATTFHAVAASATTAAVVGKKCL